MRFILGLREFLAKKMIFMGGLLVSSPAVLSLFACDGSDVIWGGGLKTSIERIVINSGAVIKTSPSNSKTPVNTPSAPASTGSSAPASNPSAPASTVNASFVGTWKNSVPYTLIVKSDGTVDLIGFGRTVDGTFSWTSSGNAMTIPNSKYPGGAIVLNLNGNGTLQIAQNKYPFTKTSP